MIRFFPALGLLGSSVALGVSCSFYSGKILGAATAKDAAPFAAPFALLATGAAASLMLAGVSICSAPSRDF
jgi:hypothetical protein